MVNILYDIIPGPSTFFHIISHYNPNSKSKIRTENENEKEK